MLEEQNATPKNIIIDLENSIDAHDFKEANLIHICEFEKAKKLINKRLELIKSNQDNKSFKREHNTISVFGDRGVGKTSFILSIFGQYKDNDDIETLPIIDPTLMEEKGHVFLLIISLINDAVSKKLKKEEVEPGSEEYHNRMTWTQSLKRLSKGLPSLDNVGTSYEDNNWQDEEYIMERGLDCVNAAYYLEQNFHKLVSLALKILNKKAFLLAFDDIDVDFKKGWPVLEVIRKYLTTPQLITILSGNLTLYSKNIRRHQWENFGKALLKNEVDGFENEKKEYINSVNEIEGQYILKLLKSENRIHLLSIYDNTLIKKQEYKIQYNKNTSTVLNSIKDEYKLIFNRYGIKNPYISNLYCNFLMKTSVRSQVHFLYENVNQTEDIDSINAFISRMYAQNINLDFATDAQYLNIQILRYLLNKKFLSDGYQLVPTYDNTDINSALTGLMMLFSQNARSNAFLIFDYWTRICNARNYANYFPYYDRSTYDSNFTMEDFCQVNGSYRNSDLATIVGNSLAYLLSSRTRNNIRYRNFGSTINTVGHIPLLATSLKSKDANKGRIDKVLAEEKGLTKLLGYIPLISIVSDFKNESYLYFSIYSLLASIGDLLRNKAMGKDIGDVLQDISQIKHYKMSITNNSDVEEADENNDISDSEDNISSADLKPLKENLETWIESYKTITIPPHVLGKISTRYYFSLRNIEENNKQKGLGDLINLCIVSLFNACLIEEAKENRCDSKNINDGTDNNIHININNVSTSADVFINNLSYIENNKHQSSIPFTCWLMKCPLLYPYVNVEVLKDVNEPLENASFLELKMVDILNKVSLKYQPIQKQPRRKSKSVQKDDKPTLCYGVDTIKKTIEIIEKSRLDINTIINGSEEEAKQELGKVFKQGDNMNNGLKKIVEKLKEKYA